MAGRRRRRDTRQLDLEAASEVVTPAPVQRHVDIDVPPAVAPWEDDPKQLSLRYANLGGSSYREQYEQKIPAGTWGVKKKSKAPFPDRDGGRGVILWEREWPNPDDYQAWLSITRVCLDTPQAFKYEREPAFVEGMMKQNRDRTRPMSAKQARWLWLIFRRSLGNPRDLTWDYNYR